MKPKLWVEKSREILEGLEHGTSFSAAYNLVEYVKRDTHPKMERLSIAKFFLPRWANASGSDYQTKSSITLVLSIMSFVTAVRNIL